MVQRYYAYAILVHWIIMIEPCVTGDYDVIDISIENVNDVYSYLRRNQKKLSFEKSYKNITGSSLLGVASTINTIQNQKKHWFWVPCPFNWVNTQRELLTSASSFLRFCIKTQNRLRQNRLWQVLNGRN